MSLMDALRDRFLEPRIARIVQPYTLVGRDRIRNLYRLARRIDAEAVPGDVIECGVCNGGTAAILARCATKSHLDRTLWLLDSFEGMPSTGIEDTPSMDGDSAEGHVGKELGDISRVREVLRRVGADMSRVRILKGWFEETFPEVHANKIALLNIDADWYTSVKLCLENFYDRVAVGGFISIDDYGHWPGCRRAVDEFFAARGLNHTLNRVDYTARWLRKD